MRKAYTLTMGGKTFAVDCPKVEHTNNEVILQPNTYNVWGVVNGVLTISKEEDKPNVSNNYSLRLTAGTEFQLVLVDWEVSWVIAAPTFTAGKTYEINIIDNIAMFVSI